MKYEKCLTCGELGKNCDGPNFLAMDACEIGQWCNDKRKQNPQLTYDRIASDTGLSKSAVYNFLSGSHTDYRFETIRAIAKEIIGGEWDDNPCGNLSNTEKAQYEDRVHQFEESINWRDDKIAHLLKENEALQKQNADAAAHLRERYDFLKRKDRTIWMLASFLFVSVIGLIVALIY